LTASKRGSPAHAIAGDEYVAIGGGASIAQQALQAEVRR
jgi:hypothetical protein